MTPSLSRRLSARLRIESLEGREVPAAALGVAGDYSLFALHDINLSNSMIEGRAAVGGNASFTGYSIGDKLSDSNGTRDDLIVGGNLTFTNGQVANGNAVYGGTGTFSSFGIPNGTTRQQTGVINFGQAETALDALSDQDAALPANGAVSFAYGNLTLTGTNPGQNVFNVTDGQLWNATNLVIKAPAGSSVIVNVSGANNRMQSMGMTLQGVGKDSVVLNFPQATQLTLGGVGVTGSILAPRANVDFSNGNVQGSLVASSWTGSGVINYTPPTPPPAGTSAISGLVYRDLNQDGHAQDWEWREAGATVTLTGTDLGGHAVSMTTTTDQGGIYWFRNLAAGTYQIRMTPTAEYTAGVPTTGAFGGQASAGQVTNIAIPAGQTSGGYNFGELATPTPPVANSQISGMVYRDENRDGHPQNWEWREAGATVTLTGIGDHGFPFTLTTTADQGGIFWFRNLAPGTYSLKVTPAAGLLAGVPTTRAFGGQASAGQVTNITIPGGQTSGGYDFGELAPQLPPGGTSQISGMVYRDQNTDGHPQDWEWREAGVSVVLTGTDVNNNPVSLTATTDQGGIFWFRNLPAGTYALQPTAAQGFGLETPTTGAFGGTPTAGLVTGITIPVGQTSGAYDFGEIPIVY